MTYYNLKIISVCLHILIHASDNLVSSYEIVPISVPEDGNLEGPQWSVDEQALYWVNLPAQRFYRWDSKTGYITSRSAYGVTSFIMPVKDHPGYVVISVHSSVYLLKWGAPNEDSSLRLLTTVDRGLPDNTINDAKVDAAGRLWFGTTGKINVKLPFPYLAPPDQGTLYCMDFNNFADPTVKKRPVSISNGIAFSHNNKKMYYNDSPTRKVVAFDYDLATGFIANETVVFDFDYHNMPGIPDGLTIDEYGNLWVATFTEWVLIINPDNGELLGTLKLPVDRVSSMTWGGQNLDTLYMTTSRTNVTRPKELSGSLLRISNLGVRGVPEHQFVFPLATTY